MTLRKKLFLSSLATMACLCAVVIFIAQQLSLSSFSAYQESVLHQQANSLSARVAETLKKSSDWSEILDNPQQWQELQLFKRPLGGPPHKRRPPPHHRPPPPGGKAGAPHHDASPHTPPGKFRFFLLDKQNNIIGVPSHFKDELERKWPITNKNGEHFGWLALPPAPKSHNEQDREFRGRIMHGAWMTAFAAAILAVLFSALLSSSMRRPLTKILFGTRDFAAGYLPTDLPVNRKDEFGELALAFDRMCKKLQRARVREKQWIADVAHELRTPLAVLTGEVEAIQDGVIPASTDSIQSLGEEISNLNKIVEDLHLLSSAESGSLLMDYQKTDIPEMLQSICDRYRSRLQEKNLSLELTLKSNKPGKPMVATIDERRLHQVLSNLLENTVRYASPGAVIITASQSRNTLLLSVQDSGPGVPSENIPYIFDRLYRSDTARARITGGSGLGLSICKSIIEAHNGNVSADNVDGGLRVTVEIPLQPPKQIEL